MFLVTYQKYQLRYSDYGSWNIFKTFNLSKTKASFYLLDSKPNQPLVFPLDIKKIFTSFPYFIILVVTIIYSLGKFPAKCSPVGLQGCVCVQMQGAARVGLQLFVRKIMQQLIHNKTRINSVLLNHNSKLTFATLCILKKIKQIHLANKLRDVQSLLKIIHYGSSYRGWVSMISFNKIINK